MVFFSICTTRITLLHCSEHYIELHSKQNFNNIEGLFLFFQPSALPVASQHLQQPVFHLSNLRWIQTITVSSVFYLQKSFNTGLNMLYCDHISRMWSWLCFPAFHEEVFNQQPGILSVRFLLLRLSQGTRNLVWCSSERCHLKYRVIVFQKAVPLFVLKNPQ